MVSMEKVVFATLEEQSRYINQTFKQLGVGIKAWLKNDEVEVSKQIAKISSHEKKSLKLKNKMLTDVAQAASIYRSDFLRLVLKMESVASYQGGAAVRLGKVLFKPAGDDAMVPYVDNLIDVFIVMGDNLSNLMKKLGENMSMAGDYCLKIDETEEKVDDAYRSLEAHLYSRKDIDIRDIMQLRTVFLHVEEACDIVESVADSVRIILATH